MTIWHPFTQEKTAAAPLKIVGGSGEYLFDSNGKKYIDMISSWWVNTLGHANKEIADAIYAQAMKLEHVIFAGFTHDPAEELCSKLSKFLPASLSKFFFSDNGSTAVEVALKMAYQYFANQGLKGRKMYINLEGGYHGDTMGAMSASGKNSMYHSTFAPFFFDSYSIDFPADSSGEVALEKLHKFLEEKGDQACALIIEPLVQGAAGMRMYSPAFLDAVVTKVRKYGVLVIFDEVMTGFYRTGRMFSMDHCASTPDMVCLSKGITGGFMPLSLTVANEKIYNAFLSDEWQKAFIHGHSYTANPLACAAACKSLEILERPETLAKINRISEIHKKELKKIGNVKNKRQLGTIAAFDLKDRQKAKILATNLQKEGIIIRPINEKVYLLPPYCISENNLEDVYKRIFEQLPFS